MRCDVMWVSAASTHLRTFFLYASLPSSFSFWAAAFFAAASRSSPSSMSLSGTGAGSGSAGFGAAAPAAVEDSGSCSHCTGAARQREKAMGAFGGCTASQTIARACPSMAHHIATGPNMSYKRPCIPNTELPKYTARTSMPARALKAKQGKGFSAHLLVRGASAVRRHRHVAPPC